MYNETIAGLLAKIESAIYLLVALFLVIMALMSFFIVGKDMAQFMFEPFSMNTLVHGLQDLLVTLIIAELIQTVIVYIESHQLDLKLILGAGLTAMIRRVLVFGVEKIPWEEMAITAVLIVALVVAIYYIGDKKIRIERSSQK
ncbi:phosphate-starvation-inducible PsiE family protein [Methanooceanicella nereidis]|nr:phosphate-starvation-inducible PsiE family protein [Methanocella sp. CWC-04]